MIEPGRFTKAGPVRLDLGGTLEVGRDPELGGASFRLILPLPAARSPRLAGAPPGSFAKTF